MTQAPGSNLIDQLVSSYLELPVSIDWQTAKGIPFPTEFEGARLKFGGLSTSWMDLQQVVWCADRVRFVPGLPAHVQVEGPRVEIAVGQAELDRWLKRFELPYRIELADDALIVHTELAGFPIGEFETRLEVVNGWFVLQPKRASILGVPNYVATLFRTYLPIPPLSRSTRLERIDHKRGQLRVTFRLEDFDEAVTPGLLNRLNQCLRPTFTPDLGAALGRSWRRSPAKSSDA
ncbi:MAG: hypothetical protein R3E86_04940 [Pseudomonadales bacterium]